VPVSGTQKVIVVVAVLLALLVIGLQAQSIAALKERVDEGPSRTGPPLNPRGLFGSLPTLSADDVRAHNELVSAYEQAVSRRTGIVIGILVLGGIAFFALRSEGGSVSEEGRAKEGVGQHGRR